MMIQFGRKWLFVFLFLIVVSAIAAFFVDYRLFLLTLIFVFVIIPMQFAFLYYYYGLNRECFMNVVPHSLSLIEDGIEIRMFFPPYNEDDINESSESPDEKSCVSKEETKTEYAGWRESSFIMPFYRLKRYIVGRNSVIIPISGRPGGFLWLPESSFNNSQDFVDFIHKLKVGESIK